MSQFVFARIRSMEFGRRMKTYVKKIVSVKVSYLHILKLYMILVYEMNNIAIIFSINIWFLYLT